jgi:hypothetical protein
MAKTDRTRCGEGPEQYPEPEEFDEDVPRYGKNLVTGEIITFGKRGPH